MDETAVKVRTVSSCGLKTRMIMSAIGILVGVSVFIVFTIQYKNLNVGLWGLLSGTPKDSVRNCNHRPSLFFSSSSSSRSRSRLYTTALRYTVSLTVNWHNDFGKNYIKCGNHMPRFSISFISSWCTGLRRQVEA